MYILNFPVMHDGDCVPLINISSFGVCGSPIIPKGPSVSLAKEGPRDGNGDFTGEPTSGVVKGVPCLPVIVGIWQNPHRNTIIGEGGNCSITVNSFLVCAYGGLITVIKSGQEKKENEVTVEVMSASEGKDEDSVGIGAAAVAAVGMALVIQANKIKAKKEETVREAKEEAEAALALEDYNNGMPSKVGESGFITGLSLKGMQLLMDIEIPAVKNQIKKDKDGNILAIRNHNVGESGGGVTVGIGTYVAPGNTELINMLKDKHGVIWDDTDQWVDFDVAIDIFEDVSPRYTNNVNKFAERNSLSLTQEEFDALYIFGYNRPVMLSKDNILENLVLEEKNIDEWKSEIIDLYKGFGDWEKFGVGWTNRFDDTLELYFNGDYKKDF